VKNVKFCVVLSLKDEQTSTHAPALSSSNGFGNVSFSYKKFRPFIELFPVTYINPNNEKGVLNLPRKCVGAPYD
jgi:hypothetical protein